MRGPKLSRKLKWRKFKAFIFRRCHHCRHWDRTVKFRRQNTAYCDNNKNYVVMCDCCNEENEAYLEEQWKEVDYCRTGWKSERIIEESDGDSFI